ncbi:hypothetical protein SCHPADRAFT_582783 [Schizopora paradoxa]|uniref:Uncharacterized protein n=1 Tax=Schizopora paradoxa TaxID=27342 RepID=A0A0H2RAZ4_9AGAM|nr:hypothetical protein SCHPADRAFT_582783 [Schizopora paradoxa]
MGRNPSFPPTVFASHQWMALYRVSDYALSNYYHGHGLHGRGRNVLPELTRDGWLVLSDLFKPSPRISRKTTTQNTEAFVTFYVAQSVDIDRYCKREVLEHLKKDTEMIQTVNLYSRYMNRVQVLNGLVGFAFIPLFRNVPYLRRFRSNVTYFTSNNLPEIPEISSSSIEGSMRSNLTVDTMLLDGHTLVCIGVDGREAAFNSTGHYPILGGYDAHGAPLYVAAIHLEYLWYFTSVKEGAKSAKYIDELGKTHVTTKFFVLGLRYDPCDTPPPYPRARRGAMDATGPVSWMRLWPEKDPEYFEDDCLVTEDRRLTTFLDEFSARSVSEHELISGFPSIDLDY